MRTALVRRHSCTTLAASITHAARAAGTQNGIAAAMLDWLPKKYGTTPFSTKVPTTHVSSPRTVADRVLGLITTPRLGSYLWLDEAAWRLPHAGQGRDGA
jgi:hypothetical protein